MPRFTLPGLAVAAVVAACVTGCGSRDMTGDSVIRAANPSNIHRLTNLYSAFATQHGGNGPRDEKEFREYIAAMGPHRLGRMGIDPQAIDKIFTSERDSQPFIIRYGRKGSDAPPSGSAAQYGGVIVLEAQGADGTRRAGFIGTLEVRSLDAAAAAAIK